MKAGLTIGELAKKLRLNPKTIRYYEEVGLLPKPRRSENGYRLYQWDELGRLQLVRRAKHLGLTLAEIKELVEYAIDGRCSIFEDRLLALLEAKLNEIDHKIEELVTLRSDLRGYHSDLSRRSSHETRKECRALASTSCRCIGEDVDGLRK